MAEIVYADANIYLNLFFEEDGRWLSPYEEAINFFNRVDNGEFKLGYSRLVISEVKNKLREKGKDETIMDNFLAEFEKKDLLVKAEQTADDEKQARKISPKHYQDPLHAILAVKISAKALVSRDNDGFPEECIEMIYVCKPESLP
ncbi:MAG: hypothetical protein ABIB43_02430 [archaeon]